MLDFLVWAIPISCAVILLIQPVCNYLEDRYVYCDNGYGRARARFMDDARARGLTNQGAHDELFLREELVRLRRIASDAVREDPDRWLRHIEIGKSDAVERVRVLRPDLAPAFGATVNSLGMTDVLYPGEVDLVLAKIRAENIRPVRATIDQLAALKIIR